MTNTTKLDRAIERLSDEAFTRALGALQRYQRRQARDEHPDGKFDSVKRWYPSADEDCGVTSYTRSPSRAFPNSYMTACRTLAHCEVLDEADHDVVLLIRRWLKAQGLEALKVPEDVIAQRRAARLEAAIEAEGPTLAPVRRRVRL